MKKLKTLSAKTLVLSFLVSFSGLFVSAQFMGITNRPRITSVNSEAPRVSKPQVVRVVSKTVYKTKEITKFVNPTGLYVETLANAEVSLESITAGKKIKKTIKADNGSAAFENLPPGKYKL